MTILAAANTQRLSGRSDIMSNGPEVRPGCRVLFFEELSRIIKLIDLAAADVNGFAFN
jgi:hypothetical protein